MRKILITGGAGFIGSALADRLSSDKENNILVIDNLLTGKTGKLSCIGDNCRFLKCDVNNYKELSPIMISNKFDYVFHYAAVVGVRRTQDNPLMVLNDIEGIKNILSLSQHTGVKRFFTRHLRKYTENLWKFHNMLILLL